MIVLLLVDRERRVVQVNLTTDKLCTKYNRLTLYAEMITTNEKDLLKI